MSSLEQSGDAAFSACELRYERVFAAPPERVFHAWTDPQVLARWWGPKGCVIPEISIDLREGGEWMTLMREPDGGEHRVSGVYREIVPPRRLVFTWAWDNDGERGHESTVTVEFEAAPGGTLMRFHQATFRTAEMTRLHNEGWTSCLDGFEEFVAAGNLA